MGLADGFRKIFGTATGGRHTDGVAEIQIGDPRFDDWDIVQDFEELETARAFRQTLAEQGVDAVLTSDWPLDRWGRGDISLRVPEGQGIDAEELLDDEPD